MFNLNSIKIAVIGLGYVGLPLAVALGQKYALVGFDINISRIKELQNNQDSTNEMDTDALRNSKITFTSTVADIAQCNTYIVTVPTPVDEFKKPNLKSLLQASEMLGKVLKKGDTVVYESTVYPGCTEEDCIPILEKTSGLTFNKDFFCGYSPERINPGDKQNTVTTIKKVVSGSTTDTANFLAELYGSIVTGGIHIAPSIKVAEASKAIENAQRDVNISFVNELALMFDKMGIDTQDVLAAAATKWNFLPFKPGLVGGHCIGVDPYYLMHKAESVGYFPQVILSGRRINDDMGIFVANKVIKLLIKSGHTIENCKVLVLGFTFKENCPDYRNTRVIDIVNELQEFGTEVIICDPWVDANNVKNEYNVSVKATPEGKYDAIILAVAHQQFLGIDARSLCKDTASVVFDTKAVWPRDAVTARL